MPDYPKEVQGKIDYLSKYKLDDTQKEFNILHMYPQELAFPNGFYDSMFFNLHLFNEINMTKRILKYHDELRFDTFIDIQIIRIFADGSTIIKFKSMHRCSTGQSITIE